MVPLVLLSWLLISLYVSYKYENLTIYFPPNMLWRQLLQNSQTYLGRDSEKRQRTNLHQRNNTIDDNGYSDRMFHVVQTPIDSIIFAS